MYFNTKCVLQIKDSGYVINLCTLQNLLKLEKSFGHDMKIINIIDKSSWILNEKINSVVTVILLY